MISIKTSFIYWTYCEYFEKRVSTLSSLVIFLTDFLGMGKFLYSRRSMVISHNRSPWPSATEYKSISYFAFALNLSSVSIFHSIQWNISVHKVFISTKRFEVFKYKSAVNLLQKFREKIRKFWTHKRVCIQLTNSLWNWQYRMEYSYGTKVMQMP